MRVGLVPRQCVAQWLVLYACGSGAARAEGKVSPFMHALHSLAGKRELFELPSTAWTLVSLVV